MRAMKTISRIKAGFRQKKVILLNFLSITTEG